MLFWRLLKIFFFVLVLTITFSLGVFFYVLHNHCIDFSPLERYNSDKPTIVLDDEGQEWTRFQLDKREPVTLDQLPAHLIQAFLAAEDWDFFRHSGISFKGILRSSLVNLYHGRKVQGASTITQQLVKLLFFDSKKTFERKIKEQLYALLVERQYSKEQILELYLNHVYFGCGIYGVQAACQRFWGKSVKDISIAQAALLAGIVRSPGNYCPLLYPESAQKRRNVVLRSMYKIKSINNDEYETAKAEQNEIYKPESTLFAPHLREALRIYLEEEIGHPLYGSGLVIQTTINRDIQEKAESIFKAQCEKLNVSLHMSIDGGLISMDTKSGEIKALIGGYDYAKSKFNRALQAKRQIGSIIKPLIYAVAIREGLSFADTDLDEPFEMSQANGAVWAPHNYNDEFEGKITLAYALSHSNNIVAIKTLLKVGALPIIDMAKKCGLEGAFHTYPSLALGCVDGTLREAVGMFNVFANAGVYVEPHYIRWVKDQWGKKIFKYVPKQTIVMSPRISARVSKVLSYSLERIHRSWQGQWLKCQAFSKTGTTNDSRVCWYAGSTPNYTTAVYIGCDDNKSMGQDVYPLRTAFPIWFALNQVIEQKIQQFATDPSLHEIFIDEKSGQQTYENVPGSIAIFV